MHVEYIRLEGAAIIKATVWPSQGESLSLWALLGNLFLTLFSSRFQVLKGTGVSQKYSHWKSVNIVPNRDTQNAPVDSWDLPRVNLIPPLLARLVKCSFYSNLLNEKFPSAVKLRYHIRVFPQTNLTPWTFLFCLNLKISFTFKHWVKAGLLQFSTVQQSLISYDKDRRRSVTTGVTGSAVLPILNRGATFTSQTTILEIQVRSLFQISFFKYNISWSIWYLDLYVTNYSFDFSNLEANSDLPNWYNVMIVPFVPALNVVSVSFRKEKIASRSIYDERNSSWSNKVTCGQYASNFCITVV